MGMDILAAGPALAATGKTSSGNYSFLIIIVLVFGLMYFFMIRPQRNRQRQAQQQQRQAGIGARVRTTAGMYGTIVDEDDDNVMVEVAPGVQIKMMRRAIMNTVADDEPDGMRQKVPDMGDSDTADTKASSDGRGDLSI
jgi:preprotein translocase subunit YajC